MKYFTNLSDTIFGLESGSTRDTIIDISLLGNPFAAKTVY